MQDSNSLCRITRVVDGDDRNVQLAQWQTVMQRIRTALRDIPTAQHIYLGNALLNLAVNRILSEEASRHTTAIIMRLSDAMRRYSEPPESSQATDLESLHG